MLITNTIFLSLQHYSNSLFHFGWFFIVFGLQQIRQFINLVWICKHKLLKYFLLILIMAIGIIVIALICVICVLSTFIFVSPARSPSILFFSKNCLLTDFLYYFLIFNSIDFCSFLYYCTPFLFCTYFTLIFFTFLSLKFRWICYFCSFFNICFLCYSFPLRTALPASHIFWYVVFSVRSMHFISSENFSLNHDY